MSENQNYPQRPLNLRNKEIHQLPETPTSIPVFDFNYHGYECHIHKATYTEHLTGYVILDNDFPLPKDYEEKLLCHGGITYKGEVHWKTPPPKDKYCIGFDCAHYRDLTPGMMLNSPYGVRMYGSIEEYFQGHLGNTYKGWTYVMEELMALVVQLENIKYEHKRHTADIKPHC